MRAVNLIPSDSRSSVVSPGAGRSGGAAYVVLGLLGGLALLVLLYGTARRQVSDRRGEVTTLSARAQKATAEASRLTPYTSFISLREQRTQAVMQLVDSRFDWAHAFHELGRVLPSDVSITSLDGTIGAAAKTAAGSATAPSSSPSTSAAAASSATGASGGAGSSSVSSATPPGSVPAFTLTGCATSQAEVAVALERLRLIDGVNEVNLQSSSKPNAGTGGSAGGGNETCPKTDPAFTVQLTFDPLPTQATTESSTKLTSETGAGR